MIEAGVIGVSGFSGFELTKILLRHPSVRLSFVGGFKSTGYAFNEVFPQFTGYFEDRIESLNADRVLSLDVVFLCLPHGKSMEVLKELNLKDKTKVIDLSADFRLPREVYERWYGSTHMLPEMISEAVYGLCEWNREAITGARFVANPGCYPTAALLAIVPLLGCVEVRSIIIDAKSGVSGAGRSENPHLQFCEVNENFKAYSVAKHRHTPEIEMVLSKEIGRSVQISFSAHLLPIQRGILSTIYLDMVDRLEYEDVFRLYSSYYKDSAFVRVRRSLPEVKDVVGTNFCDIGFVVDERTGRIVVVSVIDNLVKGASGQAVQNMNLMFGFDERDGLFPYPFYP